jgi:hypothetical protein
MKQTKLALHGNGLPTGISREHEQALYAGMAVVELSWPLIEVLVAVGRLPRDSSRHPVQDQRASVRAVVLCEERSLSLVRRFQV